MSSSPASDKLPPPLGTGQKPPVTDSTVSLAGSVRPDSGVSSLGGALATGRPPPLTDSTVSLPGSMRPDGELFTPGVPLGTSRPLTDSTVSLAGSVRPDSEVSTPSGQLGTGRPLPLNDSTVSLPSSVRPDSEVSTPSGQLGTGRPLPLTDSTVSLPSSVRPDSEVSTPSGAAPNSSRPFLTAASSLASMDDSTVSLAGTDRPDLADLEGEGLSSDDDGEGDAGVVSGSLQFALNTPVSEVRATVQQEAVPEPPAVKEAAAVDLGQELDESATVYTGRPGDPEMPEGIDTDTVTVLTNEYGCKAWLIGTAHFSKKSQEDVAKLIQFVQPECVMLELCRGRVNILEMDEDNIEEELKALNMERIIAILRQNGTVQGCLYLLMLNLSAHLTRELGMAPGGEFRVAYQEARKLPGCEVRLGDRPIQITIQRALSSLSVWKKIRLAYNLLTSKGSITKEEVERCKQKELLEEMLEEMAGDFPGLGEVFVNERDIFLCASLADATRVVPCNTLAGWRPSRTVGVVGMGHVPGMIRNWGKVDHRDQAALMRRMPPTLLGRAVWLTVRVTFWGVVAYTVYRVVPVPRKEAWVTGLREGVVSSALAVKNTVSRRFTS